jgi:hypothetical protein
MASAIIRMWAYQAGSSGLNLTPAGVRLDDRLLIGAGDVMMREGLALLPAEGSLVRMGAAFQVSTFCS